jgi:hypothetical protein
MAAPRVGRGVVGTCFARGLHVQIGDNPQQQAGQPVCGVDWPLAGGVGVQRQEELPIRKGVGQPVRGVHREGGLADPGHAADGVDVNRPATRRRSGQCLHQVR